MNKNHKPKDIMSAFANHFSNLDIDGLASLLEEEILYGGGKFKKSEYLDFMSSEFSQLKKKNISHLLPAEISCLKCNIGLTGYIFVDKINKSYYSFVLEVKENTLMDIIECNKFNTNYDLFSYKHIKIKPEEYGYNYNDLPF